ncbi:MAG: sigma 54-interacting transcriptional regulator [Alphaproteobacteria bacterium]|nr:sigma 54-interacting transcriptional regulator [Alphaproteobacteria bacterium]
MTLSKKRVVLGFYGSVLDAGGGPKRWERWRPTVSLFQQPDLHVDRLDLLVSPDLESAAAQTIDDIRRLSPETEVVPIPFEVRDPWDFEEVYGLLHDHARARGDDPDDTDLLVHITTGSHVMQICLFLLTEAHFLPGRLLQTAPPRKGEEVGHWTIIDLELDRYAGLASRFEAVQRESTSFLKAGIDTRNAAFNALVDRIERVALRSSAPILLTGPTGAGKTRLARRIYELRRQRVALRGPMVEVNCATLRGDQAMAALFGHVRGAFTGAVSDRRGLLAAADGGLLFLDEIAELGLDEQAMLLRAIEEHRFLPVGSDREIESTFQLIAGTHADLGERVRTGRFREDLLARIDLWHFHMPGLAERREDIEPNLAYELDAFARDEGRRVTFTREARERFLDFALHPSSAWRGNFRELHAAVQRMATLAEGGRVRVGDVEHEIGRLEGGWTGRAKADPVAEVLGPAADDLDRFDRVQLADVIAVCRSARSLSDAGRLLFAESRKRRASVNDADRLRKYLARFSLTFADCAGPVPPPP